MQLSLLLLMFAVADQKHPANTKAAKMIISISKPSCMQLQILGKCTIIKGVMIMKPNPCQYVRVMNADFQRCNPTVFYLQSVRKCPEVP